MTVLTRSLLLAALVSSGGATLALAETLGDRVRSGAMSQAAFEQLIAHTGLTADEAASKTLNQVYRLRSTND
jgi:hypothetical protein